MGTTVYNPLFLDPNQLVVRGRMTKKVKKQMRSPSYPAEQIGKVGWSGSGAKSDTAAPAVRRVSPASERTRKETSIRRRTAMSVLASR